MARPLSLLFEALFLCWILFSRVSIWKVLKYSFLGLLIFGAVPILRGIPEGIWLVHIVRQAEQDSARHFAANSETARWLDYYSVPGAPSIHDVGVAPYFVPELRDPKRWWEQLGLTRVDLDPRNPEDLTLGQLADLDVLYKRRTGDDLVRPWHHWVFVSTQQVHFEGLFFDDWDEAFNQLLQHHYAKPSLGEFHFMECPGNYLCDLWYTRGPALIHFTTAEPTVFTDYALDQSQGRQFVPGHKPVTARIIEFPLKDDIASLFSPSVFPSPFEQMRLVTSNEHAWETFPPYLALGQMGDRLWEKSKAVERSSPGTYGRLARFERYLEKAMGIYNDENIYDYLNLGSIALVGVLATMGYFVTDTLTALTHVFLGKGHVDREARAHKASEKDQVKPQEDNFMAQMLQDFMGSLDHDVEALMQQTEEGRELLDNMWDAVRTKPRGQDEDRVHELWDKYMRGCDEESDTGTCLTVEERDRLVARLYEDQVSAMVDPMAGTRMTEWREIGRRIWMLQHPGVPYNEIEALQEDLEYFSSSS